MVSTASLIGIVFTLTIATMLPVAALIIIKIKYKTSLLAALVGAAGFVTFALILEQLLHSLVIPQLMGNALLYCVYGCLAAGVFEETARLVGFKILAKTKIEGSLGNAVMYGIGHGGIEALLIVGMVYFNNLVISLGVNAIGVDKLAQEAGSAGASIINAANQLISVQSGIFYIAGLERILAMALHLGLSLLMWLCVTKGGPRWLYPACIVLHALANSGAAMLQTGIIANVTLVYIIMGITLAIVYSLFFRLYNIKANKLQ